MTSARHPTPFPKIFSSWYIITDYRLAGISKVLPLSAHFKTRIIVCCNFSLIFMVLWITGQLCLKFIFQNITLLTFWSKTWNRSVSETRTSKLSLVSWSLKEILKNIEEIEKCWDGIIWKIIKRGKCDHFGNLFLTLIPARHAWQMPGGFKTKWLQITPLSISFLVCIDLKRGV